MIRREDVVTGEEQKGGMLCSDPESKAPVCTDPWWVGRYGPVHQVPEEFWVVRSVTFCEQESAQVYPNHCPAGRQVLYKAEKRKMFVSWPSSDMCPDGCAGLPVGSGEVGVMSDELVNERSTRGVQDVEEVRA